MSTRRARRPRNLIDGAGEASMVELATCAIELAELMEEQERTRRQALRSINPAAIAPSPQHSRRIYGRAGVKTRGRRR